MMRLCPLTLALLVGCSGAPGAVIGPNGLNFEDYTPEIPVFPPPSPTLDAIYPAYGISGIAYPVRLELTGRRFATDARNVVTVTPAPTTVAPTVTLYLNAASERRITFSLAKCVQFGGHCFVLGPGDYSITVTTPAGTSNAVYFRLCTLGPRCPLRRTWSQ